MLLLFRIYSKRLEFGYRIWTLLKMAVVWVYVDLYTLHMIWPDALLIEEVLPDSISVCNSLPYGLYDTITDIKQYRLLYQSTEEINRVCIDRWVYCNSQRREIQGDPNLHPVLPKMECERQQWQWVQMSVCVCVKSLSRVHEGRVSGESYWMILWRHDV